MRDKNGRTIDYIRVSVTDRCNLRCRYCMPEEGIELMRHEEVLSYQEIIRILKAGTALGIKRVKVTGGEPLVRRDIAHLIKEIAGLDGIEDVTMTTNGCLLGELAPALKEAGLSSVNVSLDTLDPVKFHEITRRDRFYDVMGGINQAIGCGLRVKINCAVMEGLGKDDILAFAEFSERKGIPVRFIEMMPIGQGRQFHALDNKTLLRIFSERYEDFKMSREPRGNGPAVYYTYAEGAGCVGFISAVHHKFCGGCNRVRVTSDGFLKLCLDSPAGVDLRTPIRRGISDDELRTVMERSIYEKPESHHFEHKKEETGLNMNQIGG